ncbi:MAG: hypothetical protein FWC15_06925 [Fibromonadales bacterium]|nr:hypothetical protein [Fibromonadales bacterium]
MFENPDFQVFIIQCAITWIIILAAIIMCVRDYSPKAEIQGASTKNKATNEGKHADSKPQAPMLNFVTVDEIFNMSLEVLQSVPPEHMEQLPPDKKQIVKRRINDLIQEERKKQNK